MTQRFWSKVVKSEGCWPWRGSLSTTRYGRFGFAGKTFMAHRVAYELTFGTLPPGMLVCHHCDNPPCVKPEHLFAGTVTDNAADMVAKDRSSKGTRNHKAKLSAEDVVEIRATYAQGGVRQVDLAAHFGVTQSQISAILRGASWVR